METVYIIEAQGTNRFKVGHTEDFEARLAGMQTDSAAPLSVHKLIENDLAVELEQFLHSHLESYRVSGEWFEIEAEDLDHIVEQCLFEFEWSASSRLKLENQKRRRKNNGKRVHTTYRVEIELDNEVETFAALRGHASKTQAIRTLIIDGLEYNGRYRRDRACAEIGLARQRGQFIAWCIGNDIPDYATLAMWKTYAAEFKAAAT